MSLKKKIFFLAVFLLLGIAVSASYLNRVVLPTTIKNLIVDGLRKQTEKNISLQSLEFNIFKGLVLRNLVIADDKNPYLVIREASCTFLIWPIFQKKVIIPSITFKKAVIFLKRKWNNTFNFQDLLTTGGTPAKKEGFGIAVYKINIVDSVLNFQDDMPPGGFKKAINNFNLRLHLALPASVKINLKGDIEGKPGAKLGAWGEYNIVKKEMNARISLQNLAPGDFAAYYQWMGITLPQGQVDALINTALKNDVLTAAWEAQNTNLSIWKDKIQVSLSAKTKGDLRYGLKDARLKLDGNLDISDAGIAGLEFFKNIDKIRGELKFNEKGVSADKINAEVLGIPVLAKIRLIELGNPLLKINITSSPDLTRLPVLLKERFNIIFPGKIQGAGNLSMDLESRLVFGSWQCKGVFDAQGLTLALEKPALLFEGISGRISFDQGKAQWAKLNFKFQGFSYESSGTLSNFKAPAVQLGLSSQDLNLNSNFSYSVNNVKFTDLSGSYLNSGFRIFGNINFAGPTPLVEGGGSLNIDTGDFQKMPFKKVVDFYNRFKPQGHLQLDFGLAGCPRDFKSCQLQLKAASKDLSLFGLKADGLSLAYNQADGMGTVPLLTLSLYDGSIESSATINLGSDNLPYLVNARANNIKIEKLKMDTAAKDKDIAGSLSAQLKLNGFWAEPEKLSGSGRLLVANGKLWQLNLFQGLGALLFVRDFASITFSEGACDFLVQDKNVFTENLSLKSNIADLSGQVRVGFDSSIDASLNVHVEDENVPLSGTFKDVATAIIGQAGKFGVIRITGTLKDPKYKFQPAVVDIIKSLKDSIFGR